MTPLRILEKNQTATQIITLGYMSLIFWYSHQPRLPAIITPFTTYGIIHIIEYLVLGLLLVPSLKNIFGRPVLAAFIIAVAYGLTDEFHQSFTPGRVSSIWDILSNTMGAGVGVLLYSRCNKIFEK